MQEHSSAAATPTFSFLSASATATRQSPSPNRLHVWMQLLNADTPATGSLHASSHSRRGGSGAAALAVRAVRSDCVVRKSAPGC